MPAVRSGASQADADENHTAQSPVAPAAPAVKRAPTSSVVKSKAGKRKTRGAAASRAGDDSASERIATALLGKSALAVVVDEWMADWRTDSSNASMALVNSLLSLAGSNAELSLAQYDEGQTDDNLELLNSAQLSSEYALSGRGKAAGAVRKRVEVLWQRIGAALAKAALDDAAVDALVAWVTAISASSVRAYRHTATLAALSLARAFAGAAHDDVRALSTAKRQSLAAAKRASAGGTPGSGGKRGAAAAAAAAASGGEARLTARVKRFDELLSDLFDGVLVHRYRDTVAELRAASAAALGDLVLAHPHAFLGDAYLKYLGWLLHDRDAVVRDASLRALSAVYGAHADSGKLNLFSQRFKARVLEMTLDRDDSVAVAAVGVCLQLAQMGDVLEHADTLRVYRLTHDSRPRVRAAAARFANDYYLEFIVPENIDAGEDLHESQLKALVEFVVEFTKLPDNPAYLVDALHGVAPALGAWRTMATLLEAPTDHGLEPGDALSLARLCSAAARKATGQAIVPSGGSGSGSGSGSGALSRAAADAHEDARAELARAFGPKLPALLARYVGDGMIVAALAELVPCMALSHAAPRSSLKAFADALAAAVRQHTQPVALEKLGAAWRHALLSEHTFVDQCRAAAASLLAELERAAADALTVELDAAARSDRTHAAAVAALRRAAALLSRVPRAAAPGADAAALDSALERYLDARCADDDALAAATELDVVVLELSTPRLLWQAKGALDLLAECRAQQKAAAAAEPEPKTPVRGRAARPTRSAQKADADNNADNNADDNNNNDDDDNGEPRDAAAAAAAALDSARQALAALSVPRDTLFGHLERLLGAPSAQVRSAAFKAAATLGVVFGAQRPANALSTTLPLALVEAVDRHVASVMELEPSDADEWCAAELEADAAADAAMAATSAAEDGGASETDAATAEERTAAQREQLVDELQALTLSAFVNLIATGAFELQYAVRVYTYYVHDSKRCQAVVRTFHKLMRDEIDTKYEFEWLHRTLVRAFEFCVGLDKPDDAAAVAAVDADDNEDDDDELDEAPDLSAVRALATRIAQSFAPIGACPPKYLRSLSLLICEGMGYAMLDIDAAVQEASAAGGAEAELDNVDRPADRSAPAKAKKSKRIDFVAVIEPLLAKLTSVAASKVLDVFKEKAQRAQLSRDNATHDVFFALEAQLERVARGLKVQPNAISKPPASAKKPAASSRSTAARASKRSLLAYDDDNDNDDNNNNTEEAGDDADDDDDDDDGRHSALDSDADVDDKLMRTARSTPAPRSAKKTRTASASTGTRQRRKRSAVAEADDDSGAGDMQSARDEEEDADDGMRTAHATPAPNKSSKRSARARRGAPVDDDSNDDDDNNDDDGKSPIAVQQQRRRGSQRDGAKSQESQPESQTLDSGAASGAATSRASRASLVVPTRSRRTTKGN